MKKSILCGIALVAGLWSCTEDYKDWSTPQSNTGKEAASKLELAIQPTIASIDFATYTDETVQLFTSNLSAAQASEYTVAFSGENTTGTAELTTDPSGTIATEDLKNIVNDLYGANPTERTLSVTVSTIATNATADGEVKVLREANPFTFKAKLAAPFIDDSGYYIVGNFDGWACKRVDDFHMVNNGGDVYDNPEFSVEMSAVDGVTTYEFKAIPASDFNADGSVATWDRAFSAPNGVDVVASEGVLSNKNAGGNIKFEAVDGSKSYIITINAMTSYYTVKSVSAIPEYYGVGTMTSWNNGTKVSAMFPTSGNTITLTTYFTGAWDLRMWPAENFGDWSLGKAIGTAVNGDTAASGSLCWNNSNDGNLASPEAGYYTLDCDLSNMTYKWTKYAEQTPSSYEKIGLVGGNDDWDNDVFLTQVENTSAGAHLTHLWYALNVKIEKCSWGVQFRVDGKWDKQWGKGDQGFPFAQSNTKDNIPLVPGTYNVYFNDITGHYFFVAQ